MKLTKLMNADGETVGYFSDYPPRWLLGRSGTDLMVQVLYAAATKLPSLRLSLRMSRLATAIGWTTSALIGIKGSVSALNCGLGAAPLPSRSSASSSTSIAGPGCRLGTAI